MSELNGGCLCGAVRYTANAEPEFVGLCHCTDCQKHTGSAFAIMVRLPKTALQLQGTVKTFSKPGDSGNPILRYAQNAAHPFTTSQPRGLGRSISMLGPSMIQAWSPPRWRFIAIVLCLGSN
jgi:hypothetical protein